MPAEGGSILAERGMSPTGGHGSSGKSSTENHSAKETMGSAVDEQQGKEKPPGRRLWSYGSLRLRVAIALALALTIEGLMRSNINMAMVCMVNRTAVALLSENERVAQLPPPSTTLPPQLSQLSPSIMEISKTTTAALDLTAESELDSCANFSSFLGGSSSASVRETSKSKQDGGELVILKSEQALIFTSFYAGGLLIVMPGSYLCDRFGARTTVFYGATINVLGTFLTPLVARELGAMALVVLRFLMGCGQGILVPCMNVLIASWFPLSEKSTAIAIATTGNQLSVIVAMFLTAELCQFEWLGGWASAFYAYGFVGIIFCLVWLYYVYDSPSKARHITDAEVKHIRGVLKNGGGGERAVSEEVVEGKMDPKEVPWKRILRSPVVWTTSLCSFSQNFMNVGTVVYLPSYYSSVLHMNLSSNGLMSAFPFIVQLLSKIVFASIADFLRRRKIMSHSAIAKLFNFIGSVGAGVCFLLLSFCDCNRPYLAITLVILAVGISSGFIPGYNTSVVCIAPRYTSSVASFSRLLGQIASVASPYMIGLIVVRGTKDEWKLAFWMLAFILISTGLLFQCWGSASIQSWAKTANTGEQKENSEAAIASRPACVNDGEEDNKDYVAFLSTTNGDTR